MKKIESNVVDLIDKFRRSILAPIESLRKSVQVAAMRPSTVALLALMKHLRAAVDDPEIAACPEIHGVIEEVLKEIEKTKVPTARTGNGIAAAFSKPKSKATNTKNAAAVRKKEEYEVAQVKFDMYASQPDQFTSLADYISCVQLCVKTNHKPDDKTVRKWFHEFLGKAWENDSLSEAAKEKFKKFKPK